MPTVPCCLAFWWPFASPWLLLWALAAAIPIIIHLWSKRRYREVTWAAMEYLLAAVRKNARRIRIEQLILLAVRASILLMLALALADPFFSLLPMLGASGQVSGQTHWVLVLDASYSMDYKRSDTTRFQAAQQLAAQLVEHGTQGDGFTLISMSDPPQVIVPEPAFASKDIQEELDNLQLLHGGADLPATLAEIERILESAADKHPRLTHGHVCFFTDLGRTTWDDVMSSDCRSRIARIADTAAITLFDIGEPGAQNLAITGLDVRESLVTVARDVSMQVEVQNFDAVDRPQQEIALYVDGQRVREQAIDVPAQGRATAMLVYRFDSPGEHHVEARLAADALEVDNHRWASVPVRESIRVLCIRGTTDAARYVALALEPSQTPRPRVRVDVMAESALLESDLNDYDCVFLCNVGRFGRDEASVLHRYLKNGGGLVFFLGDQVQAENYNAELGGEASTQRVLPARVGNVSSDGRFSFDPLDYGHPIVAPFRGVQNAGLLTTPVWKYYVLTPYDRTTAKVALAFAGGDPAIVEESILRGRSIMFATAPSAESVDGSRSTATPWNALAAWPSFPPLVQETLAVAVSGRTEGRNLEVGQDIHGSLHSTIANLPLTVVDPEGRSERVPTVIDGEDTRWTFEGTRRSGIYESRYGPPLSRTELFAVNVDTRESNPERFDPELLPSQFSQDFELEQRNTPALPMTQRSQYFRFFLTGVLVLLLLESLLAWRFGSATN
jgi:Mg-chelatase subunit ChlD